MKNESLSSTQTEKEDGEIFALER